ncbi:alcohol dehydrogenase catalytic domain-containing protein [Roseobacter sp. HKCCD9010]|uniref:zinc-dependent alcohol dehydrogenase n=1 Tax=unclassified Roseobacter TaxID=196798 RepID=UPI0014915A72|nr:MULTISPECIES: alcohol dehydrogenase catalytic domain-containing protein [unclassified Roseobacter]MBF9051056.1 alcohol dehydrogenase catalytic domain-containing protein [Rhodobacterales bacterium HKCCD4356]NNV12825.1 alcohol dehydrogenase catalytic domain-containing protein [Roseobacter sp. HKCCD7357]NNV16770.1 alcohol dehydrogenase catalytic domain-containing protein [Roseobacter sp. HKCCD8768]NNV26598.1 alcohol dehydrogenase catalytic domain-containing protein [Roseobacter sp. HKCCD8192]N
MKALVYDGPETLAFRDVPDAVAGQGEQLIKILSVGICGSDMHAFLGHDERRPAPLILGHEAAGIVVGGARDGERVTLNPLVTCGTCAACTSGHDNLCAARSIISMPPREGAFAQYVAMRDENLVTVPDHVTLDMAALAEPIACGWHAVRLAKHALAGVAETALVIGGGAIGLGAALSLTAQGVPEVTILEPNEARREVLTGLGNQTALAPDKLSSGAQFDLVVDGVGYAATRATASAHARPGGVIAHIGLGEATGGLDIRRMTLQEITFFGTYTYTAQDFRKTAAAIFDGRLGSLHWTEARPLADGASAFADIRAGRSAAPKIVLNPHA